MNIQTEITHLNVFMGWSTKLREHIGILATDSKGKIGFEFSTSALAENRTNMSPYKLNKSLGVQIASTQRTSFNGLFGVFSDSLPDGWGMLLMERAFRKLGRTIQSASPLSQLAYLGANGMGALEYEPCTRDNQALTEKVNLASLYADTRKVLNRDSKEVLQELIALGGSPGGARPKVTIFIDASKISGTAIPATFILARICF